MFRADFALVSSAGFRACRKQASRDCAIAAMPCSVKVELVSESGWTRTNY